MLLYLIKSFSSLLLLYLFFHFFLRSQKVLLFNRFFLLFSLIFSLIIPFANIPIKTDIAIPASLRSINIETSDILQREFSPDGSNSHMDLIVLLEVLYISISSIILIRFVRNLLIIIRKIRRHKKIRQGKIILVLTNEDIVPHSFLQFVFINESQLNQVPPELMAHEVAHCRQYHTLDVIFLQVLIVFLWANPLIWLYKKAILLNHEYYSDDKSLGDYEINNYQQILLKYLTYSNTQVLASSFKDSLVKKRIIMMTKEYPENNATLRKLSAILLLMSLAVVLSCTKDLTSSESLWKWDNQWWYPILQKQNLNPSGFNNFEKVFEMGTTNSISDGLVTLENAVFIIRPEGDAYTIIRAPKAFHDLKKNVIEAFEGTMESYNLKSKEVLSSMTFDNLTYQVDSKRARATNVNTLVKTK